MSLLLFVFDFHHVLVKRHAKVHTFDSFIAPERLRSALVRLVQKGHRIAIASGGDQAKIIAAMKQLLGSEPLFSETNVFVLAENKSKSKSKDNNSGVGHSTNNNPGLVLTSSSSGSMSQQKTKADLLEGLMRQYNLKNKERVRFFDNSKKHVDDCQKRGFPSYLLPFGKSPRLVTVLERFLASPRYLAYRDPDSSSSSESSFSSSTSDTDSSEAEAEVSTSSSTTTTTTTASTTSSTTSSDRWQ